MVVMIVIVGVGIDDDGRCDSISGSINTIVVILVVRYLC